LDRGSAPILAVFLLGTIVAIFTVSSMLKSGYERQVKELVLKQAGLVALGTLKSVEVEVNQYLRSAACSAMFEVGEVGGDENEVLQKVMEAARKLENAWSFPNVSLSLPMENLGEFLSWTPDGSLEISGLLPASVKHVMGPEAWGIRLEVTGIPRFRRMRQLSYLVIPQENFLDFLSQLNENFREEGFFFEATSQGIVIKDLWAERVLVSYLT
jgi:hypothetical protein